MHSILARPDAIRELGPGFYTALSKDAVGAHYDRRAVVYDAIVGRAIYHRIFWGTSPSAFSQFGRAALAAAGTGYFAEAACGSLVFTSAMYRDLRGTPALLIDRSIQMLRRAKRRLAPEQGSLPPDLTILHSDVATLPVRPAVFSSILSLNVLHVPCDVGGITAEFERTLVPEHGRLFVSSLVRSGRWSDSYMAALYRMGELGAPVTLDELRERVAGRWGIVESTKVEGNMAFLVVRHAG